MYLQGITQSVTVLPFCLTLNGKDNCFDAKVILQRWNYKTIEVYKSSVLVQTTQYKVQHEIVLQMTSALSKAEEGMLPQHFIGTDV